MQTAPLKEKDEIKIFILYLLKNINYPLDFANINDIVVQDGFVGYFDFVECFAELLDAGHVIEEKVKGTEIYMISDTGVKVAENLQEKLLGMVRDKGLKNALRLLSFKKRGADVRCSAAKREDGRYDLNCKIIEKNVEMLNVNVVLETKSQVDRMQYYGEQFYNCS